MIKLFHWNKFDMDEILIRIKNWLELKIDSFFRGCERFYFKTHLKKFKEML